MKGRVRIELRDKEGNLVHSQEKHNVVTNFMNDMYVPMGFSKSFVGAGCSESGFTPGSWFSTRNDLAFFDTIQLLAESLNEDPNDYDYNGEEVVGLSRYGLGYAGSTPIYGTSNGSESGWNADGTEYTYTYDWHTSAANGTIKAIALSPIWSCVTGSGTSYYDYSVTPNNSNDGSMGNYYHTLATDKTYNQFAYDRDFVPLVADYNNNVMYSYINYSSRDYCVVDNNGDTKFTIYKTICPLSKIFTGRYKGSQRNNFYKLVSENISLTIKNSVYTSTNNTGTNYGFVRYNNGKFYVLLCQNNELANGNSVIITCYDLETKTESFITFTNNTGCKLYMSNARILNDKLVVYGYNSSTKQYIPMIIDLQSGNVTSITYAWNDNLVYGDGTSYSYTYYFTDCQTDCFYMQGYFSKDNSYQYFTVNINTGKARYASSYQYGLIGCPVIGLPNIRIGTESNNNYYGYFYAYPTASTVFTTKFNLETPVVKSEEQSLKIIYTLRFED